MIVWLVCSQHIHRHTYWPSTKPSIKRCTCVNKRKNSWNRCSWDNFITRCLRRFEPVGDKIPNWEPAAYRGLWALGDPWLSNLSQDEEEVLLWSEAPGVNKAVCSVPSSSLTHYRNITLSRINCERLYFYKEMCSCVHWSSSLLLTMFLHIFLLCICMWLYNNTRAHRHTQTLMGHGLMVIVVENGHHLMSSNSWWDCLHLTKLEYIWGSYDTTYSPSSYGKIKRQTGLFSLR